MDIKANQENSTRALVQNKQEIFDVAQHYHNLGLHVVVVHSAFCQNMIKRGKAPTHMNWQKERLTSQGLEAEMSRVWEREGGVNIGIVTGKASGIVCIDIDCKQTQDGESASDGESDGLRWYYKHKDELGNPIVEKSGGKGLHLYYKYPQNTEWVHLLKTHSSKNRLFKGVDILADGGAQVVTWPSLHGQTKEQYTFERGLNLEDVLHEADELPKWIVDLLLVNEKEATEPAPQKESVSAESVDLEACLEELKDFPAAVQGHGGDLQTLQAAYLCRDFGLDEKQVYEILAKEYNPRCSPPWEAKELHQKVKNAFRYGRMSQGNRSVSAAFEPVSDETLQSIEAASVASAANARGYSKKNAIHSAQFFIERNEKLIGCYDHQLVFYDVFRHCWRIARDSDFDGLIYRDIARWCNNGEMIQTMKVTHIADIRKAVRLELNRQKDIPDVHWRNGRKGTHFLTLANGILNIEEGILEPHDPDWFCFQSLSGLSYKESANCETFQNFLNDIWDGDQELIESLRLWMGYCLLAQSNLQRFAVFKGASRAGKSTLMSVFENVLGRDNVGSTSLSLIGSDFGLESLLGKRMVVFQDADKASHDRMGVATERIKSIASNDPLGINRKGQTVVFHRLNAKLSFVCNKVPPFLNDEGALTNRMIVFPFWKSFQGREDLNLPERLAEEAQGIFNWALVGARRLLKGDRLFTSERGKKALQEITEQLDSVIGFIAEGLTFTDQTQNVISAKQMWDGYKAWCKDCGRMPKNKQRFFVELNGRKEIAEKRIKQDNIRSYQGVKLIVDENGMDPLDDCPF